MLLYILTPIIAFFVFCVRMLNRAIRGSEQNARLNDFAWQLKVALLHPTRLFDTIYQTMQRNNQSVGKHDPRAKQEFVLRFCFVSVLERITNVSIFLSQEEVDFIKRIFVDKVGVFDRETVRRFTDILYRVYWCNGQSDAKHNIQVFIDNGELWIDGVCIFHVLEYSLITGRDCSRGAITSYGKRLLEILWSINRDEYHNVCDQYSAPPRITRCNSIDFINDDEAFRELSFAFARDYFGSLSMVY